MLIYINWQDIKTEIILNPRAAGPEGSLIGIPGMLLSSVLLPSNIVNKEHCFTDHCGMPFGGN